LAHYRLVADLVKALLSAVPYTAIKSWLMASYQMTGYQRAEKLFAMPDLGSRKPSDLMAAMLEICPLGEEKLFFQGLPQELRMLLAKVDKKDPKELPEQADKLWYMHDYSGTLSPVVAVEAEEESIMAAVCRDNSGCGGRGDPGCRGCNTAASSRLQS
jgi:hypothetical protein